MVRESAWKRTKAYLRRMRANRAGGWIALLLLLLLGKEVTAEPDSNETIDYRLPKHTVPISYDIKFVPHLIDGNFTFDGEERISIRVLNETSNITLHAFYNLKINETATNLTAANGTSFKPKVHSRVNTMDFLILTFEHKILPGNYSLSLKFSGNISKETVGIYRSFYFNEKNEKVWIVATKFSPTKARRAFPCWDEPALKATFNLSIKHYSNYTAASNMPVVSKTDAGDGKMWTNFQTTPNMSTYLVAFVITDFSCISNANKSFNICANKEILPHLAFVQEVQDKALPLLVQYTGIPYALPKLDSYAIPEAETGAMENWGLAIYRDSKIVFKNDMPDTAKEPIAELFVHELAHQWFGNLVSPSWWKYVWLKEGLSHYFQFYITDQIFPEWQLMTMFVTRILQLSTFNMDASTHYNYLNWDPKTPAEIKFHFSTMTYQKGSVIMHMLSNIISKEVFQAGIRIYLKKHQYGVATSDDFWHAMQEAYDEANKGGNINVKDIMEPWTEQSGYPIVKVVRDYETGRATINQTCNIPGQPSNRWCIPINYVTKSNLNFKSTAPTHWLKAQDTNLIIDGLNKDDWLIVNIQQSGYYRVDYDEENWKKIATWLSTTEDYAKIHVLNRAQLINDLSYFVSIDCQNYTLFFELTQYLAKETSLIPWRVAGNAFRLIKHKVIDNDTQQNIRKYVVLLMKEVISSVGLEDNTGETYWTKKKRSEILQLACKYGHADCQIAASKKLLTYLESSDPKAYIENWAFCYGAAGEKIESLLYKKIEAGDTRYFKSLGCSKNKTHWWQYIEKAMSNSSIPKNNTRMALGYVNSDGADNWDKAVDYYIKNFDRISKYFNNLFWTSSILSDYIWRAPSADRLQKIREFSDKNQDQLQPWVKTAIPQQLAKLEWSQKNAPVINQWLNKQIALMSKKTPKS